MSGQETPTRGQGRAEIYSMRGKPKKPSAMNCNFNHGALLLQARACKQPAAVKVDEGWRTKLRPQEFQGLAARAAADVPCSTGRMGICNPQLRLLQ